MNPVFTRRRLLTTAATGATGLALGSLFLGKASASGTQDMGRPAQVWIVSFSPAGARTGRVQVPKVVKTDAQWLAQLGDEAFDVTRKEGTERAFSGAYWNLHDSGIFHCICCDTALFDSATKFESGTGWPSFYQPLAEENVTKITDNSWGMARTAVACTRCDAHLGHVFDDGPKPTGLRFCMNSVALKFVKRG